VRTKRKTVSCEWDRGGKNGGAEQNAPTVRGGGVFQEFFARFSKGGRLLWWKPKGRKMLRGVVYRALRNQTKNLRGRKKKKKDETVKH